jgi:hypothetical protein
LGDIDSAREAAQRAAELALWAGRPADALAEVQRVIALFPAPDLTIFCGRLLGLGMRACADLAEQGAPCLVPRSNGPISAGSPPRARCPLGFGPDSTAATHQLVDLAAATGDQPEVGGEADPTSGCCGTGAAATPPRARESLSSTASAASASAGFA